jgi:hypothetical protein
LPAIVDVDDRLGGGPHGVMGFEKPHGGPLLQPALDDLTADARRSPEARDSGWRLLGGEHSYRATGLVGWWLLERLAIVLSLLTAYRAFRLSMRPWPAVGATTAAALILLGWLFVRSLSHLE